MAIDTVVDKKGIYFITFTVHNCLPLIEVADAEKNLIPKLNYIHNNSISVKWNLVINNEAFVHSSCLYN
ncbi:MAG: hypothetical protein H0X46_02565 [Bacteroidetes bacterium]|jgi:hypothetical protein|nr:hypothetical protein [Bacteroidota bacterium]